MCLLGSLVDLLHGRLLLVYQLGNLVVEVAEFDQILLNLANGGGTLEGRLAGIICLTGAGTGNLDMELVYRTFLL